MILLTGATGTVGSALLRRLTADGRPVRALVRDQRRLGDQRVRVQIALGDLSDPPSFRNALRGVQTVVHLAASIRETCDTCGWRLLAVNVRTNHVHAVVSASAPPERVRDALKAHATRRMRDGGCWPHEHSPWSRGGSRRYLWTEQDIASAVVYVRDRQGGDLPDE